MVTDDLEIMDKPGEIICKGSCKCTARTIKNCKVSKELPFVNENSISRAQRLHERVMSSRSGTTITSEYDINNYGNREGEAKSSSDVRACSRNILGKCGNNNKPNNFK